MKIDGIGSGDVVFDEAYVAGPFCNPYGLKLVGSMKVFTSCIFFFTNDFIAVPYFETALSDFVVKFANIKV